MKRIEGYITNEEGKLYIEESTGRVYMNQSAIADVCGVSQPAISKRLKNSYNQNTPKDPKGIQGMKNSYNLNIIKIDDVGTLVPEEAVIEFVDYYAGKGNKQAVSYLRSFALIGFRQATYNALGYEVPKLENNPVKTFPKYERTVSDWLEERYEGDYKLIEREYRLPSGRRIDFLLNGRQIVEVKNVEYWRESIGQLLSYKVELSNITQHKYSVALELFGKDICYNRQKEIREQIAQMKCGIKVRFLPDINLKEDRR